MPPSDPRRDRLLLGGWFAALFALSAVTDLRVLGAAALAGALLFRRGLLRTARRVLRTVAPAAAGLSLASWIWLALVSPAAPAAAPFVALALRTVVIATVTFSVLDRVDLLAALAPFPALTRLLVVTLAQIHALRLLATESRDGLESRLPRRPGTLDLLRGAGGITAALFALAARNAREVSDAMKSRGF